MPFPSYYLVLVLPLLSPTLSKTCCSSPKPSQPILCSSRNSCILRGLGNTSGIQDIEEECRLTQDTKASRDARNITEVLDCLQGHWNIRKRFEPEAGQGLPFLLEMYPTTAEGGLKTVGLDLRLHYIEFKSARFRLMNLHHCPSAYGEISDRCDPRCVRFEKTEKRDNQVFLSYDCETATVPDEEGTEVAAEGDTYLLSVCMTKTGEARVCGEFWFLVPPANSSLDKRDKDHRVLLLVDKEEYDTKSEVIVYVPTSHVLLHQADMLSIQLLHDAGIEGVSGGTHSGEGCWHGRPLGRVIHTQNITFTKDPGQNIRVRITHNLPSGRYQVAMVPYRMESGQLVAIAPPSCSARLDRLDLGQHALAIILFLLGTVIFSGLFTTMYSRFREDESLVKEPTSVVVVADLELGEEHNLVMDKFFQYLRTQSGIDRVFYARDSECGSPRGGERAWWRRALRDPRVVRDGFLIIVAGPGNEEGGEDLGEREGRVSDLVEYQLGELGSQGEEPSVPQLSLQTCITQRRFALLRFPYSDLRSLPRGLPFLVRINTVISVPLEMRELLRQIQRVEQLSPAIHWHGNLSDSDMGRDLLVSINALCTEDKKVEEMPGVRGKPWVTMLQSSVSFLAGQDEVLSVMVPLADGESEEEELLPSRRASLRAPRHV